MAVIPKVQIKRTSTPNLPPSTLDPGELAVEMAFPTRLWVGVPPAVDPAAKKLLINVSAVGDIPIDFQWAGLPPAAGVLHRAIVTPITIAASLAGSVGFANIASTASKVFTVNKISGGTTTALGTLTAAIGVKTPFTLAGLGGSLAAGDVLQIVAPTPQDSTLADIGITILARAA